MVANDLEGPSFEVGSDFEVIPFIPERDVHLLLEITSPTRTRSKRANVCKNGRLVIRQKGDECVRIVGSRGRGGHRRNTALLLNKCPIDSGSSLFLRKSHRNTLPNLAEARKW